MNRKIAIASCCCKHALCGSCLQNTLLEEQEQQPLNDLLQSAADVTPDLWPAVAEAAPDAINDHNERPLDSTPNSSNSLSVFGRNSLLVYDEITGCWGLSAAGAARLQHHLSRGHGHSSSSRSSLIGASENSSFSNSRTCCASSHSNRTAGHSGSCRITSSPVPGATPADSTSGSEVQQEELSKPQQVTQGQRELLVFAAVVLSRRQQFPVGVQVSGLEGFSSRNTVPVGSMATHGMRCSLAHCCESGWCKKQTKAMCFASSSAQALTVVAAGSLATQPSTAQLQRESSTSASAEAKVHGCQLRNAFWWLLVTGPGG